MKILDITKDNCCGCTACYAICPRFAIEMQEDQKGFLYPNVDKDKCVECNLCKNVCNLEIEKNYIKKAYIVKNKDEDVVKNSQSGGAFTAISDLVLEQDGVVYGVVLDEKLEAKYVRVCTKEERDTMRGSKYIQSRLGNIHAEIMRDLKNKKVLFSGTPCQVAGMIKYLKLKNANLENLLTIDIICHGVPSVLVWRDLLRYYEKKYNTRINGAVFRDKKYGNWEYAPTTLNINGKIITDSIYGKLYGSVLMLRESCYKCQYTHLNRVGDFTIGDAWGLKQNNPEFYDTRGTSLLLLNSCESEKYLINLKNKLMLKEVNINDYMQENLLMPSKPNRDIEEFWNDYKKKSFNYIIKKYGKNNILLNMKYVLKKIRRRFING